MATDISLLKPLGYQTSSKCGYCNGARGNSSAYYLSCSNMRVDHYQELMDRGWRRSGHTYYKPDLPRSCCPHYTIRLEAKQFRARREQRQAVNRWNEHVLGIEYKRKAASLCPQSRQEKHAKRDKFDLLEAVHKAEYLNIPQPISKMTGAPIEPAHKFEVNLESDHYTKEKHQLLIKYQTEIHKDPTSRWKKEAFTRFLCSGVNQQTLRIGGKTLKLGSYHQCYRLDGRLIAVAVLDLLPAAVSSVYLFYDPEYQDWDLGKLSAMREIALAAEQRYDWYYMGYYIHSCTKMRYKGSFEPSYILDPESLDWDLLDNDMRSRLDKRKYVSLSRDRRLGNLSGQDQAANDNSTPESINTSTSAKVEDQTKPKPMTQQNATPDNIEEDSDPSDAEDVEMPEGSLFDYNIPGVLTKDEVTRLDLDHWKLVVRNMLVEFEDLRGWEQQSIDDGESIKSITAELAAAVGPRLLSNSAVVLF